MISLKTDAVSNKQKKTKGKNFRLKMSQIRNTGNQTCYEGLLSYLYQESPVLAPTSTPTTVQEWWGSGWTTFCYRQARAFSFFFNSMLRKFEKLRSKNAKRKPHVSIKTIFKKSLRSTHPNPDPCVSGSGSSRRLPTIKTVYS